MYHSPGQGYRDIGMYYQVLETPQNREIKEEEFAPKSTEQRNAAFAQMELCELAHANGIGRPMTMIQKKNYISMKEWA